MPIEAVDIPGDIAFKDRWHRVRRCASPSPRPTVRPSEDEIDILAEVLNRLKRITILGGAGSAGAHVELVQLAGKLNAPIVHAMRRKRNSSSTTTPLMWA